MNKPLSDEEIDEYPTFGYKFEEHVEYFNSLQSQAKLANKYKEVLENILFFNPPEPFKTEINKALMEEK